VRQGRVESGRPSNEEAEALGDHIIAVADRLFIKHGYGGTSVTMVATCARIAKQTLYRRFQEQKRGIMYQPPQPQERAVSREEPG
jgi:AcrR family transcriptional regulator